MAKKFNPFVLLMMPEPTSDVVTGGGTGQSTTDPYACSFDDWMNLFATELDGVEGIDFNDYKIWFQNLFRGNEEEGEELWDTFFGDGTPLYPSDPIILPDPEIEP